MSTLKKRDSSLQYNFVLPQGEVGPLRANISVQRNLVTICIKSKL